MNPPLQVLVVDDVELARLRLQRLLEALPDVVVSGLARDAADARARIAARRPHLLLLDVDLPGDDGFELLRTLPPGPPIEVVFCTAHARFAARAFTCAAADFLLKPVDPARLREAVERVFQRRRAGQPAPHYLLLRERDATHVVPMPAIDWIEAAGNYVCLRVGGETLVHRETLSRMQARLDPRRFARIHRSRIVNVERIAKLEPLFNGDQRVLLHDGTVLVLSRTWRDALLALLAGHG